MNSNVNSSSVEIDCEPEQFSVQAGGGGGGGVLPVPSISPADTEMNRHRSTGAARVSRFMDRGSTVVVLLRRGF